MTRRLTVLAFLTALIAPAAAGAATVEGGDDGFTYTASPGEANRLVVSWATDGRVVVTDRAARVHAGLGCDSLDRHRARCSAQERVAVIRLRGGRDSLRVNGGGFGAVHASGGPGADLLRGGDAHDVLHGGPGRDRLLGRRGSDTLIDGDRSRRGVRDILDGGRALKDTVSYRHRRRRVSVNLIAGRGGERGERDALRGVERAIGGRGSDYLLGSISGDELVGLGGNDELDGFGRDDRLKGGPGRDWLRGGEGDDDLRPGAGRDRIACGLGSDEILNPIAGERMSERCEQAEFLGSYGDPPDPYAKLELAPNPVEVEPASATFDIPCPVFPRDSEYRPCDGTIEIREAAAPRRLVGSARFEIRDDDRDSRLVRVALTPAGRALVAREGGVRVDVSVHGRQFRDPTAWTVRIRLP